MKEILNGRNITPGMGYYYRPTIQDPEAQDQSIKPVTSANQEDEDQPTESCAPAEPPSY